MLCTHRGGCLKTCPSLFNFKTEIGLDNIKHVPREWKSYKQYYNDPDSKLSYVDVKHNIKKNNITPDNIGILMLSQIPLVSTTSAKAVLLKYTSISNLLTTIREDPNDLYNVHTITSDGKERKLSKSCIINIIEFMKDI